MGVHDIDRSQGGEGTENPFGVATHVGHETLGGQMPGRAGIDVMD